VDVRAAMTPSVLVIGPTHTLRQAAVQMAERHVGAAVVLDPEADGPGILTERDVLKAVARGEDMDVERAEHHLTPEAVVATPDWPLEKSACCRCGTCCASSRCSRSEPAAEGSGTRRIRHPGHPAPDRPEQPGRGPRARPGG
jgi:CBS domain-containing protein